MNFLKTLDWNTALHEGQNTLDLLPLGIRFGYILDSIPPPPKGVWIVWQKEATTNEIATFLFDAIELEVRL